MFWYLILSIKLRKSILTFIFYFLLYFGQQMKLLYLIFFNRILTQIFIFKSIFQMKSCIIFFLQCIFFVI